MDLSEHISPPNELQPQHFRQLENIFSLSQERAEELKKAIQSSHGCVEIWVHTHNSEDELQQEITEGTFSEGSEYQHKREAFISTLNRDQHLPVITFIEKGAEDEFPEIEKKYEELYHLLDSPHTSPVLPVFYVPTLVNDPTPNQDFFETPIYAAIARLEEKSTPELDDQDIAAIRLLFGDDPEALQLAHQDYLLFTTYLKQRTRQEVDKEKEQNWGKLADLFANLGIHTVIVRGKNYIERKQTTVLSNLDEQFLSYSREKVPNLEAIPQGCVGLVCKELALNNFDVRLSQVTYPKKVSNNVRKSLMGKR